MIDKIRISGPTLRLLKFLLENNDGQSGASISKATGLSTGTMYPLLQRLEAAKWLKGKWEDIDPSEAGRPARRFYKLTPMGYKAALKALSEFQIN
jgi:DNA-binding PadR family transcriptional regulator